jgi:thiol-disulfide isomerase/thioredoxin
MKRLLLVVTAALFFSNLQAQTPYTSVPDDKHPEANILNGIISKYILINDTSYKKWYLPNQSAYTPDTSILNAMERGKGKIQFVVFGGTWCDDTRFIVPKFFKIQELSGVADKDIAFFAVSREKKTLGNVAEVFKITNVPTIIVMKDGKEIGRVVEYGKTGAWDKELSSLLQ